VTVAGLSKHLCRVGQNHIFTVYVQYFWLGNYHFTVYIYTYIYGSGQPYICALRQEAVCSCHNFLASRFS
jgi:hypothetical protein